MAFAIVNDLKPELLSESDPFTSAGVQYPGNVTDVWSLEDLAVIGVLPVLDDAVPTGQVATGSTLEVSGGNVLRHWLLAPAPQPAVPDNPTLGDWRVGLTLWGRMDDVTAKVAALVASNDPGEVMLGKIAQERLEYSNNVLRSTLLGLKDAVGFTAADVDESLWRAHQASLGDLSGKWPLT